jgi:hypothetical protein
MSEDDDPGPSPHRAAIGLVAIVVLIVAVMFIMHELHESAQLQDCVSSGRTNCAPIEAPHPQSG